MVWRGTLLSQKHRKKGFQEGSCQLGPMLLRNGVAQGGGIRWASCVPDDLEGVTGTKPDQHK